MRLHRYLFCISILFLTFGCPAPNAEEERNAESEDSAQGESEERAPQTRDEDAEGAGQEGGDIGEPCSADSDCRDGMTCEGDMGCDAQGECREARPCTMDLVPYCNCEGETVHDSSTCPPFPYAHRGPCEE